MRNIKCGLCYYSYFLKQKEVCWSWAILDQAFKDGVIEKMTLSEASFGRYIMSSTIAKISEKK